ncbi:hypothetical protein ED236_04180 [Pseudomethylobacillus aquaticus]|uniref:Uncharacterized protein n=1 Tax=Pseudomethylobacillus aquaticus TaxID=2676064 RepID=A0A3N0V359_9PROT|nr:hypothetical protein [Pseudomethylobacillus aquaticus]ROH86908.1 hypothetical protein ED236_04180 [Pseudomethylobacillus aquaticus]
MTIDNMSDEQLKNYREEMLRQIPDVGAIGNVSLQKKLKLKDDVYWFVRNKLIEEGKLSKAKGKGGSVTKVSQLVEGAPLDEEAASNADRIAELDLYEPLHNVIKDQWAKDYQLDSLVGEITGKQGARNTGGKWTRPDITVASYKTYPYVPGKHFEIITFEVKPSDSIDVTAVYEALAHRRAATRAYVIIHVPSNKLNLLEVQIEELSSEAKKFGIGVIQVGDPKDYATWDEIVEPTRHEPDPSRLNDFLATQVSQGFREQIIRWFR